MKFILVVCGIFFLFSCEKPQHIGSFEYNPMPGVKIELILLDLPEGSDRYSTVHFNYLITNSSNERIKLTANNIKAKINGFDTADTKYNSLASVPDAEFEIGKDTSEHKLFFIIESKVLSGGIHDFQMIDFGLSTI